MYIIKHVIPFMLPHQYLQKEAWWLVHFTLWTYKSHMSMSQTQLTNYITWRHGALTTVNKFSDSLSPFLYCSISQFCWITLTNNTKCHTQEILNIFKWYETNHLTRVHGIARLCWFCALFSPILSNVLDFQLCHTIASVRAKWARICIYYGCSE